MAACNRIWLVLIVASVLLARAVPAGAENWPAWRGPHGDGVSADKDLPIAWNETAGIVWSAPLPEWGTSTPAIWGEAIFITTHAGEELQLLRLDRRTGRRVWTRTVGSGTAPREADYGKAKFHQLHNLASPSPVTDGETVVVHFGNGDLAAYDYDGRQLWRHNLQEQFGRYSIWWGHANSPVIHGELVISVCMQDSLAEKRQEPQAKSYLVAHELNSGRQRWFLPRQTEARAEECDAYTTPVLRKTEGGSELVVMGGNQLDAYEPETGRQLWYLPGIIGGRTVTGPTLAHDMVYVTQGMRGPLLAVRPSSSGELSRRDIVWRYTQGTPDTCCPVVWNDLLFTVSDDGIARCFDAHSGHLRWRNRLKGSYKASPVAGDGRIYFLNTEGLMTVVSASPRFDRLTESQVDDETIASPAIAGSRIFIRGRKTLYCVGG